MSDNLANTPKLRNAKACEACRVSKSRCVYKSQVGVCQRCEQNGNQCIVRSKARPLRTRASRPSGSSSTNPSAILSNSEFSITLPTVPSPDTRKDLVTLQRHHMDVFGDDDPADTFGDDQQNEDTSPTVVEKRNITLKQAEGLLLRFQSKASFFPFVQIPPESTVPYLSRTSPFLLLAILAASSMEDPLLHHQIDHEFRRVLSSKMLLQGQKSLDFLQGLLVYIAWYPVHVNPRDTTSFMYMNLAISLLIELGLDRDTPNCSSAATTKDLVDGNNFTRAARMTYLACYYTSSAAEVLFPSLKMGYRKPNNRHFRDLLDNHGEALMQEEFSTEIGSLIKLQRMSERIGDINSLKRPALNPQMEALNDEVNIQMFLSELQEWRATTPEVIKNLTPVGLAERFVEVLIYCHPLGFLRSPYRDVLREQGSREANHSHLIKCLSACKRYFEYLLSLPEASYPNFTTVQWGYMVQGILVTSRLTFLMAVNMNWDPETARSQVPLVMYLDCLCYRFQLLSSIPARTLGLPKNADTFHVFQMILGSVKKSYEKRVAKLNPKPLVVDNPYGVAPGHCPMMDPSLNTYFDTFASMDESSFDLSGSGTPSIESTKAAAVPLYHDLWATMTGSWAEEI